MANSIVITTRLPDSLIEAIDQRVATDAQKGEASTRSTVIGQAVAAYLATSYTPRARGYHGHEPPAPKKRKSR